LTRTLRTAVALLTLSLFLALVLGCCACRHAENVIPATQPGLAWVKGPNGLLRVSKSGSRPGLPVVFVHGLGGSRAVWAAQVAHLAPTRPVATLDLHGMGESASTESTDFSIPSFEADLAAALDTLGAQRFVLVGHSMGGAVVSAYAADHPDRVAGLLLDDPAGDLTTLPPGALDGWLKGMEPETYREFTEAWFGEMLAPAKPAVREAVYAQMRRTSPAVVRGCAGALATFKTAAAVAAYPGPKLTVITAENDKPYSLQNLVKDLPKVLVPGTSHWIMMDDPEAFDAVMDKFLQEVEAKR